LIFFDQPGTGASDPVTPGALPTLEQWADSDMARTLGFEGHIAWAEAMS
jgi:hypothetical protein